MCVSLIFLNHFPVAVSEDRLIILRCNNFDVDLNRLNNAIFAILDNQSYEVPDK